MSRKHKFAKSKYSAPTGRVGMSRLKLAASVVTVITILLFGTTLVTANYLATLGGDTSQLNRQITKLQTENDNLTAALAEQTSVAKVYAQAQAAGFVPATKVVAIEPTAPVALNR